MRGKEGQTAVSAPKGEEKKGLQPPDHPGEPWGEQVSLSRGSCSLCRGAHAGAGICPWNIMVEQIPILQAVEDPVPKQVGVP